MFGTVRTTEEIDTIAGVTAGEVERLRQTWETAVGRAARIAAFDRYKNARNARASAQRTGTPRH